MAERCRMNITRALQSNSRNITSSNKVGGDKKNVRTKRVTTQHYGYGKWHTSLQARCRNRKLALNDVLQPAGTSRDPGIQRNKDLDHPHELPVEVARQGRSMTVQRCAGTCTSVLMIGKGSHPEPSTSVQ